MSEPVAPRRMALACVLCRFVGDVFVTPSWDRFWLHLRELHDGDIIQHSAEWVDAPETQKAATEGALTVGLLPARTDLGWFHDHVLGVEAEVRFIRGRLRFNAEGVDGEGGHLLRFNAPFPSIVVVWNGVQRQ